MDPTSPESVDAPRARWSTGQRLLAAAAFCVIALWIVALLNPWNFLVLDTVVAPGAVALMYLFAAMWVYRYRRRGVVAVALALAIVLAVPILGLSWLESDARLPAETFDQIGTALYVEVHRPICSTEDVAPVYLVADRGLASRRVTIARLHGECFEVQVSFVEGDDAVVLHALDTSFRIEYDPHTLDIDGAPVDIGPW